MSVFRSSALLAIACALSIAPHAKAGTIPFTSDNGPTGWIYDSTNTKVGVFFFNITDIPGSLKSNGIDIYWQWDRTPNLIGFNVDFANNFPVGPLSITSATFENQFDFSQKSAWNCSHTTMTVTCDATGAANEVSNGQWWDTEIYFSDIVQGTLGFSGNLITASVDRFDTAPVPEPGTLLLALIAFVFVRLARPILR